MYQNSSLSLLQAVAARAPRCRLPRCHRLFPKVPCLAVCTVQSVPWQFRSLHPTSQRHYEAGGSGICAVSVAHNRGVILQAIGRILLRQQHIRSSGIALLIISSPETFALEHRAWAGHLAQGPIMGALESLLLLLRERCCGVASPWWHVV